MRLMFWMLRHRSAFAISITVLTLLLTGCPDNGEAPTIDE